MKVEFFRHNVGPEEIEAAVDALHGLFLTTGSYVYEFERAFAEYFGYGYVAACSSCTAALHLALRALGVGPGDEVITTPMSFIATANAIIHAGAEPVFIDVEPDTGLIDPSRIEHAITCRTRAIVPVHLYGQMADMRALRGIADEHELVIVEDSAHAVEGGRDGVRPGEMGDAACFSFYATKNLTCGEGGAVLVRAPRHKDAIRQMSTHGMTQNAADRYSGRYQHWDMTRLGWKCNMTNFQAAMLLPQLGKIDTYRERREAICGCYETAFEGRVDVIRMHPDVTSSRHLFPILAPEGLRDEWVDDLGRHGIGVTVNYRPIHLMQWYRQEFGYRPGDYPVAERIGRRTLSLPLHAQMTDAEVDCVIDRVLALADAAAGTPRRQAG